MSISHSIKVQFHLLYDSCWELFGSISQPSLNLAHSDLSLVHRPQCRVTQVVVARVHGEELLDLARVWDWQLWVIAYGACTEVVTDSCIGLVLHLLGRLIVSLLVLAALLARLPPSLGLRRPALHQVLESVGCALGVRVLHLHRELLLDGRRRLVLNAWDAWQTSALRCIPEVDQVHERVARAHHRQLGVSREEVVVHVVRLGQELLLFSLLSVALIRDCIHVAALARDLDQLCEDVVEDFDEAFAQVLQCALGEALEVSLDCDELDSVSEHFHVDEVLALVHEAFLLHLVTALPLEVRGLVEASFSVVVEEAEFVVRVL